MNPATHRGFTLIEMSIVLVIVAIVVGMSMQAGISVISAQRQNATQLKMKAIDAALMQFRVANDRLPCPGNLTLAPGSTDYGLEAGADASSTIGVGTGVCTGTGMLPVANFTGTGATNTGATAAEGALPAITLGLSPDFMLDGWGNKFRYAVDISHTAKGVFTTSSVGCTASAAITVNDQNGAARTSGAVYALISHGANGHGAYTKNGTTVNAGSSSADELTNCHCTSAGVSNGSYGPTYVQKLPQYDSGETDVAAYYFDDLVSYKERWQMRTDWDKVAGCPYIYVTDFSGNRVEKFTSAGSYVGQIGCASGVCTASSANGQFSCVGDIAIDASGNLWVADYGNNRVQKLSSSGSWLGQLGCSSGACATGTGNGQFEDGASFPQVDSSGNIWVVDFGNSRLEEFNSSGSYVSQFSVVTGQNDMGHGYSTGNFYISYQPSTVRAYNSSGTLLSQFGSQGTGTGQFEQANGIAVDSSGNVWVNDTINNNVLKFSSSGSYISQFGSTGSGNGQLNTPNDMAFDASGNIWVTDYGNYRVEEFSSSGSYLSKFGSSGTGSGQFDSSTTGCPILPWDGPIGIAIGNR